MKEEWKEGRKPLMEGWREEKERRKEVMDVKEWSKGRKAESHGRKEERKVRRKEVEEGMNEMRGGRKDGS